LRARLRGHERIRKHCHIFIEYLPAQERKVLTFRDQEMETHEDQVLGQGHPLSESDC
jgi:hypothetical protein